MGARLARLRRRIGVRAKVLLGIAALLTLTLVCSLSVSAIITPIETALPQSGFAAIRGLHMQIGDVTRLRDRLDLLRLAPASTEARAAVAEANDLVFIRFNTLNSGTPAPELEIDGALGPAVRQVGAAVDAILADGLPVDPSRVAAVSAALDRVIPGMFEAYYRFGEGTQAALFEHGTTLGRLKTTIVAALGLLTLLAAGVTLLLVSRERTLKALRQAEAGYRDIYENISDGIYRTTFEGQMISANPACVRLNGYGSEAEMLEGVKDLDVEWYVRPGRRAEFQRILFRDGRVDDFVSEIYRHKSRGRIWVSETARLVRDRATGEPLCCEGVVRDVSDTVGKIELQARFQKLASMVLGCLYQFRLAADGRMSLPYASPALKMLFGVEPSDVTRDAAPLFARIHEEDLPGLTASIDRSAATLEPWSHEYRVNHPDGTVRWLFGTSVPEREEDGAVLWHGFLSDITERKSSEARIRTLALYDPLTGVANRRLFMERLADATRAHAAAGTHGAVVFIDLDDFKTLNDTRGHRIGDHLLVEVSRRLAAVASADDLVARLGGDEFVVLVGRLGEAPDVASARAEDFAARVLAEIGRPVDLEGDMYRITGSVGVGVFGAGARADEGEVLQRADVAMYAAKSAGRNNVRLFNKAMSEGLTRKIALIAGLREALAGDGFALHFQPQVDGGGRIFGAEALLRWTHPTLGPVSPEEFVPLAEENHFIDALGRWVLDAAGRTLARWGREPAAGRLKLAVNVSPQQFRHPQFVDHLKGVIAAHHVDPTRLVLELTEHVMVEGFETIATKMMLIHALGVGLALDDFGTGYSSLSTLKRLPVRQLKIDRSFVRDLEHDDSDKVIVRAIIAMANELSLEVLAEGVETEAQRAVLAKLGCDTFQGYLFGRPATFDTFVASLPRAARAVDARTRFATASRP